MNKKKLLVDAHTFDENHQGIRTFLKGIYNAIDADHDQLEIILVATNVANLKQEFSNQKRFKFIKLKHTNKYIRLAYEIPKVIREQEVDFAHFNYFLPLFLNKKCKYIVTIHDVLFMDFPNFFPLKYKIINSFLYRRSAKKAQILTTVSEYSREMIIKNFKISGKPITILPNAVNDLYWQPHNKLADKSYVKDHHNLAKFIIFVSRLEPRKNHILLLQAYQELKLWKENYSLVFIGKAAFKTRQLEDKIKAVNKVSPNKVLKFENIDNNHLIKFYNAAELAVFPSLCEGFGIPPIESAMLQTPTLCSNVTAMRDFDFFGDFLFDATNINELKTKIRIILDAKEDIDLTRISNIIKKRYNWKNSAQKLKELILSN